MHDARQVANFLLDCAEERGVKLTNMSVLKHIYFAHGWHLASYGQPLISNRIEAWEYGPVVRAVYDAFKTHGSGPISSRAEMTDWETGEVLIAQGNFTPEISNFLKSVLIYYSGFGAFELSDLTHVRGGPWDKVWNALDGKVRLNMAISNESIRKHFVGQGKNASLQ
ncbi:Panacea domain-containing protein [Novosphingobium sp.]|uniref:Panacea domain-containing protein n=1 Tax=Novosphingobium sp. TaxID=1874826 RepID=UPI0025F596FD|nr:type II toxin-antitoxin system antitoxin SocA domain-containing protein [Novosphingobium sp.]